MADIKIVPDTGDTISFGTAVKPAQEVVITGSILNASSVGATPAAIAGAVTHAGTTGNPHNTTAANVGAEAANANIQTHVTGTGSPHTAAGVGAEPALGNPSADDYVLSSKMSGTRSWIAPPAGGVTSVSGTAPIASSGGTTPAISISAATTGAAGSMSSADKTKLDGISSGADVTGAAIHAASADTLADADEMGFWQTAGSALKKITWANIKAALKTYFDTLYKTITSDGWIALTATTDFSTTAASTSTATMNTDQTANIAVGYELRYTTGGTVRYGVVDAIAANLLTIGGYPFTAGAGNLTALAYRKRQCAEQDLFVSGPFAGGGARTNLIAADMYATVFTPCLRYAVKVFMKPSTDDTGANQTVCNLYNGANAVLTTGLTLSDASQAESVVEFGTYYEFAANAVIELGCGTEGTNDDSVNLACKVLWCYP